ACDQVRAKTAMAAWAIRNKTNIVSVGAAGGKRHAHKVDIDDLALVTHDPLLAQLRYRLRKEHGAARKGKIGVACVFSREAVMQPAAALQADGSALAAGDEAAVCAVANEAPGDGSLNCHGYGSVVSVTATFGLCAAGWVLDKIAA
ncbi:MAG: tRNA threonylcarbamoyladenosine dehydratase, partial [Polaromonas sp.]|nr:tRNA threonylcarbamoyladenosine dehydratase [Polaromonas sp.]